MRTKLLCLKKSCFGSRRSCGWHFIRERCNYRFDQRHPDLAASWNVPEVGWLYTPTFSYTISSIGIKFGSSDGRIVNAEIFSGAPDALVLLGAGELIPVAGAFASTTSFPVVNLIAGATYFVGFQNVEGLLVNFTGYEDPDATNLGGVARDIARRNRKTALANRIFIPAILATLHDSTRPRHLISGARARKLHAMSGWIISTFRRASAASAGDG